MRLNKMQASRLRFRVMTQASPWRDLVSLAYSAHLLGNVMQEPKGLKVLQHRAWHLPCRRQVLDSLNDFQVPVAAIDLLL